jgi:PAS domain-containing protein
VDIDGRITAVSRTARRLLGWREADLLGRSLLTLTGVSSGRALSHGSMLLHAVRQGRRLGIGDVELVCQDRTRLAVTCTIAPRLTDGVVCGATFAFAVLSVATTAAGGTVWTQARLAVLGEPVEVAGARTPSAAARPD